MLYLDCTLGTKSFVWSQHLFRADYRNYFYLLQTTATHWFLVPGPVCWRRHLVLFLLPPWFLVFVCLSFLHKLYTFNHYSGHWKKTVIELFFPSNLSSVFFPPLLGLSIYSCLSLPGAAIKFLAGTSCKHNGLSPWLIFLHDGSGGMGTNEKNNGHV